MKNAVRAKLKEKSGLAGSALTLSFHSWQASSSCSSCSVCQSSRSKTCSSPSTGPSKLAMNVANRVPIAGASWTNVHRSSASEAATPLAPSGG
jgi:hypothetical protein